MKKNLVKKEAENAEKPNVLSVVTEKLKEKIETILYIQKQCIK